MHVLVVATAVRELHRQTASSFLPATWGGTIIWHACSKAGLAVRLICVQHMVLYVSPPPWPI